jgi:putative hydrolase of the HAD superfamily
VLFDFGGTLDADGVAWKDRMRRLYEENGCPVPPDRFDPVFYAADDALVGQLGSTATLGQTVDRLVGSVQVGLGVSDPGLARRVADTFTEATGGALRRHIPLLRALAGRYRLGIVSNFYGNLAAVCAEAGIAPLFGALVDSTRVGATKPDPRIFRAALDALAVEPDRAVFVGDSLPRDMAGARALGMPHVWVRTAGTAAAPCCPGDRVIPGVLALEGLLA